MIYAFIAFAILIILTFIIDFRMQNTNSRDIGVLKAAFTNKNIENDEVISKLKDKNEINEIDIRILNTFKDEANEKIEALMDFMTPTCQDLINKYKQLKNDIEKMDSLRKDDIDMLKRYYNNTVVEHVGNLTACAEEIDELKNVAQSDFQYLSSKIEQLEKLSNSLKEKFDAVDNEIESIEIENDYFRKTITDNANDLVTCAADIDKLQSDFNLGKPFLVGKLNETNEKLAEVNKQLTNSILSVIKDTDFCCNKLNAMLNEMHLLDTKVNALSRIKEVKEAYSLINDPECSDILGERYKLLILGSTSERYFGSPTFIEDYWDLFYKDSNSENDSDDETDSDDITNNENVGDTDGDNLLEIFKNNVDEGDTK